MKIKPQPGIVQLKIDEATAGALNTSSRDSAVEFAEIVGISDTDTVRINPKATDDFNIGDRVFIKAWAIDIVNHEGIKYYFCNIRTGGILCKIE